MKKELDEALCRDFPLTFKDRSGHPSRTGFAFGFQCGAGWEPIIREAASKIEPHLERMLREEPSDEYPTTSCLKEKFGSMRWYTNFADDFIYKITDAAELASETTCEDCGKPGETYTKNNWVRTRCEDCKV